jgi:DNA repair photolyase
MKSKIDETIEKYSFKRKTVKTILNKRKGKRTLFMEDYTLNPYMGCSFNCTYCYVNGSKYADKTSSLIVKSNAYELLLTQLKNKTKNNKRGLLSLGSASECYMPIEKELYLTRDLLKLINRFKFPVHIITKSNLILRDIDILKKIQESAILPKDIEEYPDLKTIITFSFSTTNDSIAEIFETNAPRPSERLKTIKKLKKEGFLVGATLMPILPFISDSKEELNKIFSDFKKCNIDYVLPGGLTLFGNETEGCKGDYYKKLEKYFPKHLNKTKQLFKNKDYPNPNYFKKIYKNIEEIAKKQNIKTSII